MLDIKLGKCLIVLRASPRDWRSFNPEESRTFLRLVGLPEELIVNFVQIWRSFATLDYGDVRYRLKELSASTFKSVTGADICTIDELRDLEPTDYHWIAFTDDDDWYRPDVFAALTHPSREIEAVAWGSLRVGADFDKTSDRGVGVQLRPLRAFCYTNNYAVTGAAVAKLGIDAVYMHGDAQSAIEQGRLPARIHKAYMSCAVKHPVSTVAVRHYMENTNFAEEPVAYLKDFLQDISNQNLPAEADWMRLLIGKLGRIFEDALAP